MWGRSFSYRLRQSTDLVRALLISHDLAAHDHWSIQQIRNEQKRQFKRLVAIAAERSPFYRELYRGIRLEDVDWPAQLPAIDKPQMMARFDDVVTDRRLNRADVDLHLAGLTRDDYYLGEYRVITTAGSSGFRGVFVFNRRSGPSNSQMRCGGNA